MTDEPPLSPLVYFGRRWDARLDRTAIHVGTPVGHLCAQCTEHITAPDRGRYASALCVRKGLLVDVTAPVHMECEIRAALGGVAHVFGTRPGTWNGTYRQEARHLVTELNRLRQHYRLGPL